MSRGSAALVRRAGRRRPAAARAAPRRAVRSAVDAARRGGENRRPVTARRLLTAALAAIWLLPAAFAGAAALHVALAHGHGDEHHVSAPHDASHAVELPASLVHGHLDAGEDAGHDHIVTCAASPGIRAGRSVVAPPSVAVLAGSPFTAHATVALAAGPPPLPPPQVSGPPRLALLSTLRV